MNERVAELEAQIARTADWWNSLPIERLEREPYQLAAEQIRNTMQQMIDCQHGAGLSTDAATPIILPPISNVALGAQLRVIGDDFCTWLPSQLIDKQTCNKIDVLIRELRTIRQFEGSSRLPGRASR